MIKGKTIHKRDVFDKPHGNKIGSIGANILITASENIFQWLHLSWGGWVSAGIQQQYIRWEVVFDSDNSPFPPNVPDPIDTHPPGTELSKIIKGTTLIKSYIFNKPKGDKKIGSLEANTEIIATENIFQWLHLSSGGWVSAGIQQQYIRWEVVIDSDDSPIPPTVPDPVVTPPAPIEPWPITEVKRKGRIATLLVDWQNPKWDYEPRQIAWNQNCAYPQTVTFNIICSNGKGPTVLLKEKMADYLEMLNGEKVKELILNPGSGWVNKPTRLGTVERLTWAGNHVVVKETRVVKGIEFANVHALSCNETELIGDFFDKDMRLILHKFNAVTRACKMIKLANARDCYTPFITDPDLNNGDMWISSKYLEFWPELPFTLSDGTQILEYELYGYSIFGRRVDGKSILLRDPSGIKTNWRINSPEVPE